MAKDTPSAGGRAAGQLQQARLHVQAGELAQAAAIYERLLKAQPRNVDALLGLGAVAGQTNDLEKALRLLDRAIACDPSNALAFNNRGLALQGLQQWQASLASFERAIALQCDYAVAHYNRANLLKALSRQDEAISSLQAAISLKPDFAEAHYNLGIILTEQDQQRAALESFRMAVTARPRFAEAHFNGGVILHKLAEFQSALDCYERAIAARPDHVEALLNQGDALQALGRRDAALESYRRVIELRPGNPKAFFKVANLLRESKQLEAALEFYDRAYALEPGLDYLQGLRRHTRQQLCDWRDFDSDLTALAQRIGLGERAAPPFLTLVLYDSPTLQHQAARILVDDQSPADARCSVPGGSPPGSERIRIGYFSADFHEHATAYLIAGLLESHDRSQYEILAFSFGPASSGPMRARIERACDRFLDVNAASDAEVASLAQRLQLDIAVDLKGFTQGCRAGIFARRAAPLQVNFLGYPGTMGAPYIDYLIADRTLIPEASRRHYAEKIVYLPDSYQVNDSKRAVAESTFTRADLGLPQQGFVFCCFNNGFKISPGTFEVWMRLLRSVPDSVLWLFEDNDSVPRNLRREAAAREVDPDRLIFARFLPLSDHLARHRAADLFIDTWPCNAHTTASDALWSGLPLITLAGQSFASRVAASLLSAVGLPELIATTTGEYEDLALRLATDPALLAQFKQRLNACRGTSILFDTQRFTQGLESAYQMMLSRHRSGLAPAHLEVFRGH